MVVAKIATTYSVLAVATAAAAAAAVIVVSIAIAARERIAYGVTSHRERTQRVNQIAILSALRSRKVSAEELVIERANLRILRSQLLLSELIQHSTGVSVLIINDIANTILNGRAGIAILRRYRVLQALNATLGLAATIRCLRLNRVEALKHGNVSRVETLLNSVAKPVDKASGLIGLVADGRIQVRKAEINRIIGVLNFALHVLERHILAQLAPRESLSSSATISTEAAEAIAAPAPSENEEKYNPVLCYRKGFLSSTSIASYSQ